MCHNAALRFLMGLGILLFTVAPSAAVSGEPVTVSSGRSTLDCGVNALFLMLSVEGRPATLETLEAALPSRHPDGYSMAELAAASRALGLALDGVQLAKGGPPLDRPAIVFLKDAQAGHFALLRPVGTTGTMVQVIDAPSAPQIVDMSRLVAMKSWTGRALVPRTRAIAP